MAKYRTILITGGAKRIGNIVARELHQKQCNIMLHYRSSKDAADELSAELNEIRSGSCASIQADLASTDSYAQIITATIDQFGQLDALINNASSFYPTPITEVTEEHWQDLMASNLKAPMFLAKHAAPHLRQSSGCIINMIDIYAERPLANHPIYCAAKAGLQMLTKSLAKDLAPEVRVNGVAPGAILWPETNKNNTKDDNSKQSTTVQQALIQQIPLQRLGDPSDIAKTISFLICDAPYISGQIIAVDGGRSITI